MEFTSSKDSPCFTMPAFKLFFVLVLTTLFVSRTMSRPPRKRAPEVSVVAIWPYTPSLSRELRGALNSAIKGTKAFRRAFPYISNSAEAPLRTHGPEEALSTYCDKVVGNRANTLIVLNGPVFRKNIGGYWFQLADSLKIPVITWNSNHTASEVLPADALVINLAPSLQHQIEAMSSVLRQYDWSRFGVITTLLPGYRVFVSALRKLVHETPPWYEKDESGVRTPRSFKIMSELTIVDMNVTYIRHELSKLKESDCRVFLFFASRLDAMRIFEVANSLNLTGSEYVWIVSQSIIEEKRSLAKAFPIGLLGIYFSASRDLMQLMIGKAVNIWMAAQISMYKNSTLKNIENIFSPNLSCDGNSTMSWNYGRTLYEHMKRVKVSGVKLDENGQQTDVQIMIKNLNSDHRLVEVGSWDRNKGLDIAEITWPGDSGRPPKGKPSKHHLRVLTLAEPPYVYYETVDKDGTCGKKRGIECTVYKRIGETGNKTINGTERKCCTGLNMDLLKQLSEALDFGVDLWEVEDGFWGAIDEKTGEMNGLVRALMDKKADMVVTSLKVNPSRAKAVDFSVSYMETGIAIIVAIREGAISATAFLKPYDYPSWCLILLFSVHATGAAVFVFEWLSPRGLHQGKAMAGGDNAFSLCRAFWLMWAMLFQASVAVYNPRGMASRFLSNLWALFAVVFLAHYTANLAAFMITESEFYDLSGIQDRRLTNPYQTKPPFRFATVRYGNTESNLKKTHPKMYLYMANFSNYDKVTQGINAVKKNSIDAFIYDATVLEFWAGKDEGCKLLTVGKWYAMTGYAVAFPRGSKWREQVDGVLLRMIENGDMQRLRDFWQRGACKTNKVEKPTSHSLGILNFTSAFILLACGMIIAALFLTLEHCFFKFGRKYLREIDKCGICGLISLSMGKSLTFEQSVMEAIVMHKTHRCKDPTCESQVLKLQRELDLALFKVDKLTHKLAESGLPPNERIPTWKDPDNSLRHRDNVQLPRASKQTEYADNVPTSSRGRNAGYSPPKSSLDRANTLPPSLPEPSSRYNHPTSSAESLQTSYIPGSSQEVIAAYNVPSALLDVNHKSESEGNLRQNSQSMRRSPSYTSAVSSEDVQQKSPTKVRYHDGNYYVEVDKQSEIETVL